MGLMLGPLLAVNLLGMLTTRANWQGARVNSTHPPTSFFVDPRTLMWCTNPRPMTHHYDSSLDWLTRGH